MAITSRDTCTALVLAPRGRDAAVAAALLREVAIDAKVCKDFAHFSTLLSHEMCCAITTEEALHDVDLTTIVGWVSRQPSWSDFPFIVLTQRGAPS